ncbi:hypothetical protein KBD87_01150 [Candidatus Saccharibacteria bacterium]|nr:hypothetical protein [Candidatus Saccharibacteria bacterium]
MEKDHKDESVQGNPLAVEPTIATDQVVDEAPSSMTSTGEMKLKPTHTKKTLIIALVVLAAIVAAWVVWSRSLADHTKNSVQKSATTSKTPKPTMNASELTLVTSEALQKFKNPTTGETWYASPLPVASQGWLKSDHIETYRGVGTTEKEAQNSYKEGKPSYFEVGKRAGNTIYMAKVPVLIGVGKTSFVFFEKTSTGLISRVASPNSGFQLTSEDMAMMKDDLDSNAKVTLDSTTHYDSLSLPKNLELSNGETMTYRASQFLVSYGYSENATKPLLRIGKNSLYLIEKSYVDTKLTNIGYVVSTPIGVEFVPDYTPNTASLEHYSFDDKIPVLVRDDSGVMKPDTIVPIARGCGGSLESVTRSDGLTMKDLVAVGKTDKGRPVYVPSAITSSLVKKAYDEYAAMGGKPVAIEKFYADHAVLIIKNVKGELLVYVRSQYHAEGGCGKPVVYLYPTSPMNVSVKVGAEVTVSDPHYPAATGWRNVHAQPNGSLKYQGKAYDSLFWEGQGYGQYPGITEGTVVKRQHAAATMRAQLAQQGFNKKEVADFMDFWGSRIPNKPYIRLTWFTTEQMNALAPLRVYPKPDTIIRTFLDMDGFDSLIQLPAQHLVHHARHGFTVTEWGGLTLVDHH